MLEYELLGDCCAKHEACLVCYQVATYRLIACHDVVLQHCESIIRRSLRSKGKKRLTWRECLRPPTPIPVPERLNKIYIYIFLIPH